MQINLNLTNTISQQQMKENFKYREKIDVSIPTITLPSEQETIVEDTNNVSQELDLLVKDRGR